MTDPIEAAEQQRHRIATLLEQLEQAAAALSASPGDCELLIALCDASRELSAARKGKR